MKGYLSKSVLPVAILAAASLACSAVTSALSTATAPASLPTASNFSGGGSGGSGGSPTQSAASGVLLQDNFSDSNGNWGTGTDADSSVEYANGGLMMTVIKTHYFVYSTPGDSAYQNVHIEATLDNSSTEDIASFGVMCDQQVTQDAYYYFTISPDGEYGISKAAIAKDDEVLTNNGKWVTSKLIKKNAKSYTIGADCGDGTLTLYVDGQKIDSVQDDTYSKGSVGLFAWSAKVPAGTSVTYHSFVVTALK